MHKRMIWLILLIIVLGGTLGGVAGFFYAYYHPMKKIEGYWEVNQLIKTGIDKYHVNARVSVRGREIKTSADLYDDYANFKANRSMLFSVVDIKMNVFNGKVISMIPSHTNDEVLNSLLKAPYEISYPIFYFLDCNTVLMEQSQGHPLGTARLMERVQKIECK
ncbi:hypothetical protein BD65_1241 [Yersinia ruckeri]|uniref:hypothetical protein n=1 Tax=Yersinia ruckeri TaxID=29486 RepID=UPI0005AC2B33|nr:hypothetical protein [Yersinia ruckeri]AJI96406.1 hypothetical protein BD65_1241 [Yersinia ruckeri]MCW6567404.1 hypothetical protein [Yersinia ruckeri]